MFLPLEITPLVTFPCVLPLQNCGWIVNKFLIIYYKYLIKILAADKKGERPMYRLKEWRKAARWLEGKKRKKSWLGEYKSCIFIPPTPNSELRIALQAKEKEMRVGGREKFPIKIIETAGMGLEKV